VSIANEVDIKNFELSCQEAIKHHEIIMVNHEIYGVVQAQAAALRIFNGVLTIIEQESSWDFFNVVQRATPEMENNTQVIIDELEELNLGTIDYPKLIFMMPF